MRCQGHNHPNPWPHNRCNDRAAFVMTSPPPTLSPLTVYVCARHSDELTRLGWAMLTTPSHDDYEVIDS